MEETFLPGLLEKKIRRVIANCVGAGHRAGIAPHNGDGLGHFSDHKSGLWPLQQVRRLHLDMMSCFQLFTPLDVSQGNSDRCKTFIVCCCHHIHDTAAHPCSIMATAGFMCLFPAPCQLVTRCGCKVQLLVVLYLSGMKQLHFPSQ